MASRHASDGVPRIQLPSAFPSQTRESGWTAGKGLLACEALWVLLDLHLTMLTCPLTVSTNFRDADVQNFLLLLIIFPTIFSPRLLGQPLPRCSTPRPPLLTKQALLTFGKRAAISVTARWILSEQGT